MLKLCVLAVILASTIAAPEPKAGPNPAAKPSLIAAGYAAPVVAAPGLAYTSAYSAPFTYASYVAPSVYSSGYAAYSPYAAPYYFV